MQDQMKWAAEVSIRAPRAGRDPSMIAVMGRFSCFYPRAPGGARHARHPRRATHRNGFYPRAPGGARLFLLGAKHLGFHVSIRAPRAGRDACPMIVACAATMFLSARPGRGATSLPVRPPRSRSSFYPRAPGGARHSLAHAIVHRITVSIRAPRAGRDFAGSATSRPEAMFLSARPGRGATRNPRMGGSSKGFLSARPGRGATCADGG